MTTRSCFKQSKEPLRACNHALNSSYFLLSIPSASRRLLVVSIKLTGTRKLFFVFCRQLSFQHYNRCGQITVECHLSEHVGTEGCSDNHRNVRIIDGLTYDIVNSQHCTHASHLLHLYSPFTVNYT